MPESRALARSVGVLALSLLIAFAGCRSTPKIEKPRKPRRGKEKQEQVAQPAKEARPIGKVVHIDTKYGFVLVDVGLLTGFEPGTEIQARDGEAVTAVLKITPQALRPFLTADIMKGEPKMGDVVYK